MIHHRSVFLLLALPCIIGAQATVEAALGAGRAASITPAQKMGKTIAGTFDKATRSLEKVERTKPAARSATGASGSRAKPVVVTVQQSSGQAEASKLDKAFENPSGIQQGMDYAEIERRFGPPSVTVTTAPGEETLCYIAKGLAVDVTLRNGKVTTVRRSG
jgi:type IV secretory pathway TrbL component